MFYRYNRCVFKGSLFLVQHVLRSPKRRNEPYHRLVLGMSISDCIGNFVYFTGTWLVPKDSPVSPIWAMGNQVTCEVQGFMYQLAGIATPGYNVMLSLYYLLVVRYGWCERRIKQVESYLHAYPIIFGFGKFAFLSFIHISCFSGFLNFENIPGSCDEMLFITSQLILYG